MKELNHWARQAGYSDFDTYVRTGGSVVDARRDIRQKIKSLENALVAIADGMRAPLALAEHKTTPPPVVDDEPPDTDNAQIQGAEHG